NYGSGGPHLNIPLGTRSTFTPDTTTDPTKYVLNVIGASKSLQWTGLNGSTWDVVGVPDGNPGVINWTDGTIDEKFFNLDSVTFGDTTPRMGRFPRMRCRLTAKSRQTMSCSTTAPPTTRSAAAAESPALPTSPRMA